MFVLFKCLIAYLNNCLQCKNNILHDTRSHVDGGVFNRIFVFDFNLTLGVLEEILMMKMNRRFIYLIPSVLMWENIRDPFELSQGMNILSVLKYFIIRM